MTQTTPWQAFDPANSATWPPYYKKVLVITEDGFLNVDFMTEQNEFYSLCHKENCTYWLSIPAIPQEVAA